MKKTIIAVIALFVLSLLVYAGTPEADWDIQSKSLNNKTTDKMPTEICGAYALLQFARGNEAWKDVPIDQMNLVFIVSPAMITECSTNVNKKSKFKRIGLRKEGGKLKVNTLLDDNTMMSFVLEKNEKDLKLVQVVGDVRDSTGNISTINMMCQVIQPK